MSILQMSISAGLLVIVIVLIRAVALNRLPKKMFLALWGVALFRLLVPGSIPLPFRVPNITDGITKTLFPSNLVFPVVANQVTTGESVARAAGLATETAQWRFISMPPTTVIWLVGMLALLIFFAVIFFRSHRKLRYATVIHKNDYLNEWLVEHRLSRTITIMQSDRIVSPLAVGILKPRIVLPLSVDMTDKQLLNHVLSHEYYHIKRYDAVWKMILLLALCVHWFNPMVWLMFVLASRDLELACDEAVINHFGAKTKKAYAYMLINMAEHQGRFAPLCNGFSKNATQERIESIMKAKKYTLPVIIVAVLLVAVVTVAFAIGDVTATSATTNQGVTSVIDGVSIVYIEEDIPAYSEPVTPTPTATYVPENDDKLDPSVSTDDGQSLDVPMRVFYDPDTTNIWGNFGFANVAPGDIVKSDRTYPVNGGETALSIRLSYGSMANFLEVGLMRADEVGVSYTVQATAGKLWGTINMTDIPDGDYYVVLISGGSNYAGSCGAMMYSFNGFKPSLQDSSLPENSELNEYAPLEGYYWENGPIEVDSNAEILVSVNRNDERRYTADEWANILEKVEKGEILIFETLEDEVKYHHGALSN